MTANNNGVSMMNTSRASDHGANAITRTMAGGCGPRPSGVVSRSPRARRASGFTLVEIAVVLVIIGLLLGAILQGQQLIASSRVQNLADQQAGIQAAYFGFIDRYNAVPGDLDSDEATDKIGESIDLGGNGNGRLEDPADDNWVELNGVWEQLSKAGFIRGSYRAEPSGDAPSGGDGAPENAFNGVVLLARHNGYVDQDRSGSDIPDRLLYHFGENVPASVARELDEKLDDGGPETGSLRNSEDGGNIWQSNASCTAEGSSGDQIWDIETDEQNCNPVFIF